MPARAFLPQEVIAAKRDGDILSATQIASAVQGICDGSWSDCQLGAFAMASWLCGLNRQECVHLTNAMAASGAMLDWSGMALPGPVVDKHSTGGVGDLVSLVLAPMLAACGAVVPMITGRGLGHTGGTLDKLEAIPGYCITPDIEKLQQVIRQCGVAIVGQTETLAPADRRLYAVRDVTATIDSIPLITASILSKKKAAGIHYLVMDIKLGNGAVSPDLTRATQLGCWIREVAAGMDMTCSALLTDMNQPLSSAAGNALELVQAMHYLRQDQCPPRLHQVVLALGTELLQISGLADDPAQAGQMLQDVLQSGRAAEKFEQMCAALGGPSDFISHFQNYLPAADCVRPVYAAIPPGELRYVEQIDTRALGWTVVRLGGGRAQPDAVPDLRVGLSHLAELAQPVTSETPLAIVHARDEGAYQRAAIAVREAFQLADVQPFAPQQILACLQAGHPQESKIWRLHI